MIYKPSYRPGHKAETLKIGMDRARKLGILRLPDIDRICGLPVYDTVSEETIEEINKQFLKPEVYKKGEWRLNSGQCLALDKLQNTASLTGIVPVGGGKTFIGLLAIKILWQCGLDRAVYFTQPDLIPQLMGDIQEADELFGYDIPTINLHGVGIRGRKSLSQNDRGLWLYPYSVLQQEDAWQTIQSIRPQVVVADECHNVKNIGGNAARADRFLAMIHQHEPILIPLSGTMMQKSIMDFHHLLVGSLGDDAPVPINKDIAKTWALYLDADAEPISTNAVSQSVVLPLLKWAMENYPDRRDLFPVSISGIRRAYQHRLSSAPGVVSIRGAKVDASIVIKNLKEDFDEGSDSYQKLLEISNKITEDEETPSGEPIPHKMHQWGWLMALYGGGIYNEPYWPNPEQYAKSHGIDVDEAAERIDRSKDWYALKCAYLSELRSWIKRRGKPGLDTPKTIGNAMKRNGSRQVGKVLYDAWMTAKNAEFEGMPQRLSRSVRVCDFKVQAAKKWAKKHKKGIIWFYSREFGEWLRDEIPEAAYFPAGRESNAELRKVEKYRDRIMILSMDAHHVGKNLQYHDTNLVPQWYRSGSRAEQMMGRTHRPGQKSDEVLFETLIWSEFESMMFAACMNRSLAIHQVTGNSQKMVQASYAPPPKMYPEDFLREQGLLEPDDDDNEEERIDEENESLG